MPTLFGLRGTGNMGVGGLSFRHAVTGLILLVGACAFAASEPPKPVRPTPEQRAEATEFVRKMWYLDPSHSPWTLLGDIGQGAFGVGKSLVAGQTSTQLTYAVEGLYFLATFRPGRSVDALAEGLNPFGLLNSLLADFGGAVKAPFVASGYVRRSMRVGIQNLAMMGEEEHSSLIRGIAWVIPARHVGVLVDHSRWIYDWGGGDLAIKRPMYTEEVYASRDESEWMSMERLQCAKSEMEKIFREYSFFGYNCAGYVQDLFEIAGLETSTFPNAGLGYYFRWDDPAREIIESGKEECGSPLDMLPAVLELTARGELLPSSLKPPRTLGYWSYLHLMAEAARSGDPEIRDQFLEVGKRSEPRTKNELKDLIRGNAGELKLMLSGLSVEALGWYQSMADDQLILFQNVCKEVSVADTCENIEKNKEKISEVAEVYKKQNATRIAARKLRAWLAFYQGYESRRKGTPLSELYLSDRLEYGLAFQSNSSKEWPEAMEKKYPEATDHARDRWVIHAVLSVMSEDFIKTDVGYPVFQDYLDHFGIGELSNFSEFGEVQFPWERVLAEAPLKIYRDFSIIRDTERKDQVLNLLLDRMQESKSDIQRDIWWLLERNGFTYLKIPETRRAGYFEILKELDPRDKNLRPQALKGFNDNISNEDLFREFEYVLWIYRDPDLIRRIEIDRAAVLEKFTPDHLPLVPILIHSLRDANSEIVELVMGALDRIGPEAIPAVATGLLHSPAVPEPKDFTRLVLVYELGKLGQKVPAETKTKIVNILKELQKRDTILEHQAAYERAISRLLI